MHCQSVYVTLFSEQHDIGDITAHQLLNNKNK